MLTLFGFISRSTSRKPVRPTARGRLAENTPSTRLPSTKPERPLYSLKGSVVMIASSQDMVVRLSLSSTRRPKQQRKSSWGWSAQFARRRPNWPWSDANTSSLVVTRRLKVPHWFSKCKKTFFGVTFCFSCLWSFFPGWCVGLGWDFAMDVSNY